MGNVDRLIELLENQKMIYTGLLDVAKKKTTVLVEAKVQELDNITKVEQALVLNMAKLEEAFGSVLLSLKQDFSINDNEINITTIMNHLSDDNSTKTKALRNDIIEIINRLNQLNEHNSHLIKNSLDYINFSINLFSNSKSGTSGGYHQSGDIQMDARSIFDKKL